MHFVKAGMIGLGFIFCLQLYLFAESRHGEDRQRYCHGIGIGYLTFGIFALVSRDVYFAAGGLILMMFGFRLVSHGLDRLSKKTCIDRPGAASIK